MLFRKPWSRVLDAIDISCAVSRTSASAKASRLVSAAPSPFKNGGRASEKVLEVFTNPSIFLALGGRSVTNGFNIIFCYTMFTEIFLRAQRVVVCLMVEKMLEIVRIVNVAAYIWVLDNLDRKSERGGEVTMSLETIFTILKNKFRFGAANNAIASNTVPVGNY